MSTRDTGQRAALLQGTLELLILRTLQSGPVHGHGIALAIQARSGQVFLVDHGSLYPALQRLEGRRLVRARWGISANGRRARFYELTSQGEQQLAAEAASWHTAAAAVNRVLGPAFQGG